MDENDRPEVQEAIRGEDTDVHMIYTNGFSLGLGNADVHLVMSRNGKPCAVVNMSYTLAKTLQERLGNLIDHFESQAEQLILTTDKVDECFEEKKE